MTHEKLCTVREVAQALDVSVATVHRWINLGIISAFRIHKTVRISEGVLKQLLADACAWAPWKAKQVV